MSGYVVANKLTGKDYLVASFVQLFKPATLVMIFLLAWLMSGVLMEGFSVSITALLYTMGLYLLMLLISVIFLWRFQKKNADALMKSLGYRSSEINENCYIETYASTVSEIKWKEFIRIRELRRHFFLYADKGKFVILPKRLLPEGCAELLRKVAKALPAKPAGQNDARYSEPAAVQPPEENAASILLGPRDHAAFQFYHAYVFRKSLIIYSALMLFLTMVMALLSAETGDYLYPLLLLALLVCINVIPGISGLVIGRKNEKDKNRVTYRFYQDGFEMEHRLGKVFVQWHKLYAVRQTGSYYFLYLTKNGAAILPKLNLPAFVPALIEDVTRKFNLKEKKNRA